MDDSWIACLNSVTSRYQSAFQSQSDVLMEENDDGDDIKEEFPCPFCLELFDIIGLCCHIDDDHPVEAKNGVCPVCAMRVGVDMVAHITLQHGNVFKVQRKRKSRKSGSHSTLSLLRRELREGNLQSIFEGSSYSSNATPDPLLSSFILPMADEFMNSQSVNSADTISTRKGKEENSSQRNVSTPPLSIKDQEERARRSEFVHDLIVSTIFSDDF
ncbi:hypothetical protein vseg_009753 [Gypsophila vaccaria]